MAIAATLTITQGSDKTKFTVTDTTPYAAPETRASFTARTFSVYKSDGTLFGTYNFPYSGPDSLEVTGLTKDLAVRVLMTITPGTPVSGSVYVADKAAALTGYSAEYLSQRVWMMALNPRYELNNAFVIDNYKILMYKDQASIRAEMEDVETAQQFLDRIYNIEQYNPKPY